MSHATHHRQPASRPERLSVVLRPGAEDTSARMEEVGAICLARTCPTDHKSTK